VAGSDIGKFTARAAYDPRALNKTVHFRPAHNLLSLNEMASLWESKIGRNLPRTTLTEADLLAMAAGNFHNQYRARDSYTYAKIDKIRDLEYLFLFHCQTQITTKNTFPPFSWVCGGIHLSSDKIDYKSVRKQVHWKVHSKCDSCLPKAYPAKYQKENLML
jgi:NmrA-like family